MKGQVEAKRQKMKGGEVGAPPEALIVFIET